MKEPITKAEAYTYLAQLSPKDRNACQVDELLYGNYMLDVTDGVVTRIPTEKWAKRQALMAGVDIQELMGKP